MVKFLDIKNTQPQENDKYLLDTNVIAFLFNSYNVDVAAVRSKFNTYGDFLDKALKANAEIYISSLNLSEFINMIVRREYNIEARKEENKSVKYDFKTHFRQSEAYKEVMEHIKSVIPSILNTCQKIDDNFSCIDIHGMIKTLENDFNDEYFAYLSSQENLKLVTDDGDFKSINLPIDIITGNRNLLN